MRKDVIVELLVEAQTKAHNAHSDQIVELVRSYENHDEVIKKLIEERRWVYEEFSILIKAEETSE